MDDGTGVAPGAVVDQSPTPEQTCGLANLLTEAVYGGVWNRAGLARADRMLCTIAALALAADVFAERGLPFPPDPPEDASLEDLMRRGTELMSALHGDRARLGYAAADNPITGALVAKFGQSALNMGLSQTEVVKAIRIRRACTGWSARGTGPAAPPFPPRCPGGRAGALSDRGSPSR